MAEDRTRSEENQRQHRRFPMEVEVSLHSDSNFYMGFAENLSEGGIFVATYDYSPVGTVMEFEFSMPGVPEPIRARGIVRWLREFNEQHQDVSPGMGIQFTHMTRAGEPHIRKFLGRREPLFYDEF